jgi:hypothetical protein
MRNGFRPQRSASVDYGVDANELHRACASSRPWERCRHPCGQEINKLLNPDAPECVPVSTFQ